MSIQLTNESFAQTRDDILNLIKTEINALHIDLLDSNIQNIATHLSIAIIRLQAKNYIELSSSQLSVFKNNEFHNLAATICHKIEEVYGVSFPENEIDLITMYFSNNNLLDVDMIPSFDFLEDEVVNILLKVLEDIDKTYGFKIESSDKIVTTVGLHLQQAIYRLKNNQQLDNPLVEKIKERHPEEFKYAALLNPIVKEKYDTVFSDDEIAYLTLHFIVAMNQQKNNPLV
ncbi:BglG family transcription antiterminator [Tannockella kyphosi]|uniref:BglG family transcription antiterminator n=1 Tax=Tannockella kyphosi TaxID=2899121 RepID=UPI0020127D02|nr:PRD domain-containing protein [Tannockella kyphosi]